MSKELIEKLDNVLAGVKQAQDVNERLEQTLEGLDNEQLKSAVKAAGEAAESHQTFKQQLEAQADELKRLEALALRARENSDEGVKEAENAARDAVIKYLRRGSAMEQSAAEHIVKGIADMCLIGASQEDHDSLVKSLVGSIGPQGGYFLRPERSSEMVTRIFETSPMRGIANVVTTSGDTLEMIIDDNEMTDSGWVAETGSRGNSDTPNIGVLAIPVHEMYAQPMATQRMLDDAGFNIEAWLQAKATDRLARVQNTAFVSGNGNGKPRGFLSLAAWSVNGTYERGKLEDIETATASTIAGDDIKGLKNSLIEDYQNGALFVMKRNTWETVITLKEASTGAYLLDRQSLRNGDDLVLLGKPVRFMHDMPESADGALPIAYGNFGIGYTIVDRLGFRVIRDELTQKPYVKFYTTARVGGDVTNYQAIKRLKVKAA